MLSQRVVGMLATRLAPTGLQRVVPGGARAPVARCLCAGAKSPGKWDAESAVHGRSPEIRAAEEELVQEEDGAPKTDGARRQIPREEDGAAAGFATAASAGADHPSGAGLTPRAKADLIHFQVYVRQRLSELAARMPPRSSTHEAAELAFLEEEVVLDHMPRKLQELRDPLAEVPIEEITHTNLPLLNRFVSDAGAILPRKLTGVSKEKQKALTKAIKRAVQLALIPRSWKLPRYRHASYADHFTQPEKPPYVPADPQFRDPPDIRFPNQWENKRSGLDGHDLSRISRKGAKRPGSRT